MKVDLAIVAASRTHVGRVREGNEDALWLAGEREMRRGKGQYGFLAIVADGMGGHAAGEVASQLAVQTVRDLYYRDGVTIPPAEALKTAVQQANANVYRQAQRNAALQGMGTTCTCLVIRHDLAYASHVGDSRLYLVRDGMAYQMTEDHTLVMKMVRAGLLSTSEAGKHPERNVLTRALGTRAEVEVDSWQTGFPVVAGDTFVLCSDGLHDLIPAEELPHVVAGIDPDTACEKLVALALERGGHDNISVIVVSIGSLQGE